MQHKILFHFCSPNTFFAQNPKPQPRPATLENKAMSDTILAMKSASKVVLTGSIAIDRIMSFSGSYADHIHPEKLDRLSVSIFLDNVTDSYGGVAANIAYTNALLGDEPILLGSVGPDGLLYMEQLARQGVNITHLFESELPTATFNVITDANQNQIGGFYPGAMFDSASLSLQPWANQNVLAVVSPHDPAAMRKQVKECADMSIRLCYDIGQQVSNTPPQDIRDGVDTAELLIVNDYELVVLAKRTGYSVDNIKKRVPVVVTTFGPNGSRIEGAAITSPIEVGTAQPSQVVDPTGAGDAYRGGFLYGYSRGWDLLTCGQLGATCASFALEQNGTQKHNFTYTELCARYAHEFKQALPTRDKE